MATFSSNTTLKIGTPQYFSGILASGANSGTLITLTAGALYVVTLSGHTTSTTFTGIGFSYNSVRIWEAMGYGTTALSNQGQSQTLMLTGGYALTAFNNGTATGGYSLSVVQILNSP